MNNGVDICVYELATGKPLRDMGCPADMVEIQCQEGEGYIEEVVCWHTEYVLDRKRTPRPTMDPGWSNLPLQANGQDVALLLDLPNPCRVIYEGPGFRHEGEVVGGVAEFTTDVPGPHKVTVSAWPYLDWTEELDAL